MGLATAGPSALYLVFWFFNLFIGNNGNFVHKLSTNIALLLRFNALVIVYFILMASGSYGSDSEVALGTDWALTINDDENYTTMFNQSMLIQILNLVFSFTAFDGMNKHYKAEVKQREIDKKNADKAKNKAILEGNCPANMVEVEDYCYYKEDKDWDWEF